ncbi:MAG: apolipoprotein N-acyltransferase [Deltaproteobacteria bacterium]|nr:apolipoprotein N-acyltransferase [Deltaproteobacteria bacterium]
MKRSGLFLAGATALCLVLSFPPVNLSFLVWLALVPFFFAVNSKSPKEALKTGWFTGFLYSAGLLYWVTVVMVHYGSLHFLSALMIAALLAGYCGLYTGLFAAGLAYFSNRKLPVALVAAPLWTVLEFIKGTILSGFPWEPLGNALYDDAIFIQIVDVTGIYGLTFLIVLVNSVVYDALTAKNRRFILAAGAAALLLVSSTVLYGVLRIDDVLKIMKSGDVLEVAIIQGNVDQTVKWDPAYQEQTVHMYRDLSLGNEGKGKGTRLIVWPETAMPFFFQEEGNYRSVVLDTAIDGNSYLLFGSPSYGYRGDHPVFYNSAYLRNPYGDVTGRYDKVHLVPFGEYVPCQKFLFFIDKLVQGVGDFAPGTGAVPLRADGLKLGVLICYEAIFPYLSRGYNRQGADILVNITNDAWFGKTSAPYHLLSMAAVRAVETRSYLLRAANTGISAIIDPLGRIVAQSPLFTRAVINGTVSPVRIETLYTRYGDAVVYVCLGLCGIFPLIRRKRSAFNDRGDSRLIAQSAKKNINSRGLPLTSKRKK